MLHHLCFHLRRPAAIHTSCPIVNKQWFLSLQHQAAAASTPSQQKRLFSSLQKSFERRGYKPPPSKTNTVISRTGNSGGGGSSGGPNGRIGSTGGGGGSGIPYYVWVGAGGTVLIVGGCCISFLDSAPLTQRRRWIATSPQWEQQMGDGEYHKLLQQFRGDILPPTHRASITVHRVGQRIAMASNQFAQQYNLTHYPHNKAYTYTVVRSDQANAFVLPGNHVFVLTGLFQYVHNEDDLAAVLGHEAAHNLARHAGEKVSGSLLIQLLARLSLIVDPSGVLLTIFLPAASLFRELPNSRQQETEADQIGVHLAAMACYDPRAAKRVFANMKADAEKKSGQPPEFLSTHPSHEHRIAHFDDWLPAAMETFEGLDDSYNPRCRAVREAMKQARQAAAFQATQREAREKRQQRSN